MPETVRQQKITFGEMRESGVRGILIYCSDHKCSHSIEMSADGRMTFGHRISRQSSPVRRAVSAARPDFGLAQSAGGLNEHHPETCGAGFGSHS
jgi:hypothetical protein